MPIQLNKSINSLSNEFKLIAEDLQGNILAPHARNYAAQIFIKFKDSQKAKNLIRKKIVPKIITAKQQKLNSQAFKANKNLRYKRFLNFSLSKAGYDFLGIEFAKTPLDNSFKQGQKKMSPGLKDPATNEWQKEYQTDWHSLLIIANASSKRLVNQIKNIREILTNESVENIYVEMGTGITNSDNNHIEHFGYVDGISQPHMLTDKIDAGKVSTNKWNPRGTLDLALVNDPGGKDENSFGSYFIFRKLEQNVKAFKEAEKQLADKLDVSIEYAGAQMVGRYRNGVPLVPETPPKPIQTKKFNDFNFESENSSPAKCPFGSHVRTTNPRSDKKISSPQFPRRGITYGKNLTNSSKNPEKDVGLLFMAHNRNIASQFEFMQKSWANNTSFPRQGSGIDPIIGQGNRSSEQTYFKKWGDETSKTEVRPSLGHFVTMKGGEYFFTPSVSFLNSL